MTASTPALGAWATRPLGKVARVALAALGMVMGTLVLMAAAVAESGSWALVLLGVMLAAAAVRAGRAPTVSRLGALAAVSVAIPLSIQVF